MLTCFLCGSTAAPIHPKTERTCIDCYAPGRYAQPNGVGGGPHIGRSTPFLQTPRRLDPNETEDIYFEETGGVIRLAPRTRQHNTQVRDAHTSAHKKRAQEEGLKLLGPRVPKALLNVSFHRLLNNMARNPQAWLAHAYEIARAPHLKCDDLPVIVHGSPQVTADIKTQANLETFLIAYTIVAMSDGKVTADAFKEEYRRLRLMRQTQYEAPTVSSRHNQHLQRQSELKGWPAERDSVLVFAASFSTGSQLTNGNRLALREILGGIKPKNYAQEKAHIRAKRAYESTTPEERNQMIQETLERLDDPYPDGATVVGALWDSFCNHEERISAIEARLQTEDAQERL